MKTYDASCFAALGTSTNLKGGRKRIIEEKFIYTPDRPSGTLRIGKDENDPGSSIIAKCAGQPLVALATGCELSILSTISDTGTSNNRNSNIVVETELDYRITALGWDLSDSCIVAADISGTLHLFTKEGVLVFSKKIVAKIDSAEIISLQFVYRDYSNDHLSGKQTLAVILSNGLVMLIDNMSIPAICSCAGKGKIQSNLALLPSLLQDLSVRKISSIHTLTPSSSIAKASCCCDGGGGGNSSSDLLYFAFFDEFNRFHLSKVSGQVSTPVLLKSFPSVADCRLIVSPGSSAIARVFLLLLGVDGGMDMVRLDENGTVSTQAQPCMRLQTKLEHPGTFLSVTASMHPLSHPSHTSHTCMCVQVLVADSHAQTTTTTTTTNTIDRNKKVEKKGLSIHSANSSQNKPSRPNLPQQKSQLLSLLCFFSSDEILSVSAADFGLSLLLPAELNRSENSKIVDHIDVAESAEDVTARGYFCPSLVSSVCANGAIPGSVFLLLRSGGDDDFSVRGFSVSTLMSELLEETVRGAVQVGQVDLPQLSSASWLGMAIATSECLSWSSSSASYHEALQYLMRHVSTSVHSAEVVMMLRALTRAPKPPAGFLSAVLSAGERHMDSPKIASPAAQKQKHQFEVLKLFHYLETAEALVNMTYSPSDTAVDLTEELSPNSVTECPDAFQRETEMEEIKRSFFIGLGSHDLFHTLEGLLRNGHVAGCVYACQRHLRSGGPECINRLDVIKLLKVIPSDVCAEEFISFLGQVVLPFLAIEEINSPYSGHDSGKNGQAAEDKTLELFSEIVTFLCDKAVETEMLTGQPFESIYYIKAAEKMLDTFAYAHRIRSEVKGRVERLRPDLDLQAAVLRRWKEKLSLAEVRQLGIAGLIFKMLDSVPEETLAAFMLGQVSTLLGDLHSEMDVDLILKNWVEDNLTNKIVVVATEGRGDSSHADEDSPANLTYDDGKANLLYVSLSRLVSVTEVMRDQVMVAELVLKLLQVRLDGCSETEGRLLSLARRAIEGDSIGLNLREELQEAMRFLRRKQLAAKYNITDFDPREHTQVRHVVSIISSRCDQKDNLTDAISFASDWSHSLVDLTSLYTKALLQQIYEAIKRTSMDTVGQTGLSIPSEQQQMLLDRNLKLILEMIPKNFLRVSIYDAVTYLLEEIHELSEALKDSEHMKSEIFLLTKGASNLTCYYLDSKRDPTSSSPHTGGQPNSKSEKEPIAATEDPQYSSIDKHTESQTFRFINDELSSSLKRMNQLQQFFDIYLSLADIQDRNVCKATVIQLARKRVDEMVKGLSLDGMPIGDDGMPLLPLSGLYRRACLLLHVNVICFSHTAMKHLVQLGYTCFAMEVARSIGQDKGASPSSNLYVSPNPNLSPSERDSRDKEEESGLVLDVALTLCSIAAKQAQDTIRNASEDEVDLMAQSLPFSAPVSSSNRGAGSIPAPGSSAAAAAAVAEHIFAVPVRLFRVSRGLLKASISSCQSACMGRTLDLFHGADMVLTVLDRMEGVASSAIHQTSVSEGNGSAGGQSGRPALLQASHYKDGILMNPSKVMGKLVRFALGEIKRRTTAAGTSHTAMSVGADDAQDLVALVITLQQSENHLLAVRALFGSWNCGKAKIELLRQSLLSLSRKLLSSRDLDVSFCVSSLSALPYEVMVSQLKSAVPSIQSDFSRLQTVAAVGEELSHLWEQDTLLVVFQGIQTNARWWHTLTSLGVKVDLKAFQSPDLAVREACVKAIVPELLRKSPHDIELGLEFCRQFDLEPEFASSAYMEMILTAAPTSKKDSSWAAKLRKAATGLEERAVIQCLSRMLCKIHPLDYEKVRYTCSWLLDLLALTDNTYTYNETDNDSDLAGLPGVGDGEHRAETASAVTSAIEDDRRVKLYLDVTTYLAGLSFPSSSLQSITTIAPLYENVCGVYLERIPVWPLLSDSWGIIDPLLSSCPDLSGRLAPLCQPLRLKKSDFNSRRITALYDNLTRRIDSRDKVADSDSEPRVVGPLAREAKRLALQQVLQAIHTTISDPIQQVEILQWIFSRERCSDDASAVFALECALDILRTHFFQGSVHPNLKKQHRESSGDGMVTLAMSTYSHLTEEMMKLKCEFTVKQFCELMESGMHSVMHYAEVKPTSREVLLAQLSNPGTLLKLIFELSVTVCWNKQMDALYSSSQDELTVISSDCWSLCGRRPVRSALLFCEHVSSIVDALATHCGMESADKNAMQSPTAATLSAPSSSSLEGIRHSLIGKLLAEGPGLAQGSADGSGVGAGLGEKESFTSSTTSSSAMASVKELEAASAGYLLTPAETRRRDDLTSAFSIAALILMCSNGRQRDQYIIQLDSVMRGRGARVMRRLTARSRFRAAIALVYLQGQLNVCIEAEVGLGQHAAAADNQVLHKNIDFKDLTLFVRYLYLLAETQEIRISCTESTLLQSLGLGCGDAAAGLGEGGGSLTRLDGQDQSGDARLLARTWLQDDGQIEEVLEITRDLLVVSEVSEDNIWIQYLLHLLSPPVNSRLLLHTLTALSRHAVITRVCFGRIGGQVLEALVYVCEEALDRLQQMMDLEEARLSDPNTDTKSFCGPHGHWLDVCIALQQSVALFLFVLPLVSARVLILHDEKNSASGQHPAVGNMGKLCRRMLQMRNERAALLRGQWSRLGEVLDVCGSGCLRSWFLREHTGEGMASAIADTLLLVLAIDEDSRPNLNLNWMYGCVWRMLATVHKHLGALALSSALDHLLRDNVVPSERQVDVLQVLLASCAFHWSDYCETAKLFLQWSSGSSMASSERGSLFRKALSASSSSVDLAYITSSLQKAAKVLQHDSNNGH